MRYKRYLYTFFLPFLLHAFSAQAQEKKPQMLGISELEALFFQNNYQLIVAKYDVNKADAAILQGKLWNNPTLSINQVNFWSNSSIQSMPNIVGNFGSRQQINIDLEQVIETASKRKKRIAFLSTQKDFSILQLEETTRNLKLELQNTYIDFCFTYHYQQQLDSILMVFTQLSKDLKLKVQKQLLPQSDFYRIQSAVIDLRNQSIENATQLEAYLGEIKVLTYSPNITIEDIYIQDISDFSLSTEIPQNLFDTALEKNIDLLLKNKEIEASEKSILLEKANRFPDVSVIFNYDRGGNVMMDFVGFGAAFDIPIFNRNQGNVKIAKYTNEQLVLSKNETLLSLQQDIIRIKNQLSNYEIALNEITNNMLPQQQKIIESYSKHMLNKQISLMEFIDFSTAFLEAHQSFLEMKSNYLKTFNELEYLIGQDLK